MVFAALFLIAATATVVVVGCLLFGIVGLAGMASEIAGAIMAGLIGGGIAGAFVGFIVSFFTSYDVPRSMMLNHIGGTVLTWALIFAGTAIFLVIVDAVRNRARRTGE